MSRHNKSADDATRITTVFPKTIREDLTRIAVRRLTDVSSIIREYVFIGIEKDKKKYGI